MNLNYNPWKIKFSSSSSSSLSLSSGKNYRESKRLKSYIILLRKQTLKEQYTTEKASA